MRGLVFRIGMLRNSVFGVFLIIERYLGYSVRRKRVFWKGVDFFGMTCVRCFHGMYSEWFASASHWINESTRAIRRFYGGCACEEKST